MINLLNEKIIKNIENRINRLKRNKKLQIESIINNNIIEIKIYKKKKLLYHDLADNDSEFENLYERLNEVYFENK